MSEDRFDEYLIKLAGMIRQFGWVVQGVFPVKDDDLGFAYTVGLTAAGLPELVVSGAFGTQAQDLLNAAARIHAGSELKPGTERDDIANVPFRIIPAPNAEVGVANRMYGPRVCAVQLCWPEVDGSWPPTPRQELFGPVWWDPGE